MKDLFIFEVNLYQIQYNFDIFCSKKMNYPF